MDKPRGNARRFDPYKNFKFRVRNSFPVPTREGTRLPEEEMAVLDEIVEQGRRRVTGNRALLVGPGQTKTIAAEVIANQIGLDLYRVDLGKIVSKYIGETEKHLRLIFEAAEEAGAVLFFDEADALLGKRGDVGDSHDRYANLEIGDLLERIDAYDGTILFATNMKSALDPAFMRRIRHVIQFPFPD